MRTYLIYPIELYPIRQIERRLYNQMVMYVGSVKKHPSLKWIADIEVADKGFIDSGWGGQIRSSQIFQLQTREKI